MRSAPAHGVEGLAGGKQRDADALVLRRLRPRLTLAPEVGVGVVRGRQNEALAQGWDNGLRRDPAPGDVGKMAFETPSAITRPGGRAAPSARLPSRRT